MTDRPYTDDDLRAEAARQHAALTEDPDFMGVGEQMDDQTWRSLSEDAYDAAQRSIHDLINGAADVSEWAVNLGADGLEPTGHTLQLGVDPGDGDRPRIRLHFAFAPEMDDDARDRFVMELSKAIARNL
ncbi:hypothetical protein ACWD5R_11340 [Streptomyces sp. NPDC002514]